MPSGDFQRIAVLGKYLKRDKKRLLLILLILLPVSIAGAIQPLLVGQAISIFRGEDPFLFFKGFSTNTSIRLIVIILSLTVIFRLVLQGVQSYSIQSVGQRLTARIRDDLFAHSMALSLKYHDQMPVGKLLTRLTSDVDALAEVFGSGAVGVIADLVSLLVISITMILIDFKLGSLLIITQVPVTLFVLWLQKKYRKSNYRVREELSQLNADFQENLQGLEVVQMFRREFVNGQNFFKTGRSYRSAVNGTIFYDSSISAFVEWVSLSAVAMVLVLGGWFVTSGIMGLGELTSFILYSQRLFDPLRQLAERFTQIQGGLTAVERISELLEEKVEISDDFRRIESSSNELKVQTNTQIEGEVIFENVSFSYRPDELIIDNLSFKVSPGQNVAIVGPTGSGKTTIIRLLCRLYEPNEGRILIDGRDIRSIPLKELRSKLGVVLQDTFLFSGSVADNISLDSSTNDYNLETLCKDLGLNPFLKRLPNGLQTILRERGSNLSSGEKQLLSVARVAARKPLVLVMDEATSFMDSSTEATLQKDLSNLLKNRTALVIAHRLVTVESADRILVLRNGKLIEEGTHEQLLKLGGLYSRLSALQMQGLSIL